jgi:hypothetical protein
MSIPTAASNVVCPDATVTSLPELAARKLTVPNMLLIVNKVPAAFAPAEVKARVEGPTTPRSPRTCPIRRR